MLQDRFLEYNLTLVFTMGENFLRLVMEDKNNDKLHNLRLGTEYGNLTTNIILTPFN